MSSTWERSPGHIPGLRLPRIRAVLRKEGIVTLEQLRARADWIHWLPGIGRKGMQIVQEEIARLEFPDQNP